MHDGRQVPIPAYKNTAHALYTISRVEVLVFNYSKEFVVIISLVGEISMFSP